MAALSTFGASVTFWPLTWAVPSPLLMTVTVRVVCVPEPSPLLVIVSPEAVSVLGALTLAVQREGR